MSKVLIFPTDTVYGIGTPIFDIEGIEKIYNIKHRAKTKPLACLCANINQIDSICVLNETAKKLINEFLPGPLTIVLDSKDIVKEKIGYPTIAVRIPDNGVALSILKEYGPMLTTSVNESGRVPENEYDEIVRRYGDDVDCVYQTYTKSSNTPSTIIKIENEKVVVLREGEISLIKINQTLGKE